MSAITFTVAKDSPIHTEVKYVLEQILSVPATAISEADAFSVTDASGHQYTGLMPMVQVLRQSATTEEAKQFLGVSGSDSERYLINQFVRIASVLSQDAIEVQRDADYVSVASKVYLDTERVVDVNALAHSFVAGTRRATIADVLLYAALHKHTAHGGVGAGALKWSLFAQKDAYLAPIKCAHVVATEAPAHAQTKDAPTYVKPSEEEILRRRLEKEKAKQEKAAKAAAAGAPAETTKKAEGKAVAAAAAPTAESLDVRVGRLTNLRRHPEADRLYVEDMDIGEETRTIVSGLVEHYTPEQLNDTLCFVVCNMKPKPLKGVTSQGMVLCASNEATVHLIRPPAGAKPGDRVVFAAAYVAPTEAPPAPLSGNKIGDVLAELHTDAAGALCWKDQPAHIAAGPVVAPEMKNCPVK